MSDSFLPLLGETPLGRRVARLHEVAEQQRRLMAVALVLTTPDLLPWPWAYPLDAGRSVAVVGPLDEDERVEIVAALREGRPLDERVLVRDLRAGATEAALSVVSGEVRETAVLGARGDGKSVTGGFAWVLYAQAHTAAGGALPVKVLVATTAMTEHRDKLCDTLREDVFGALWQPRDDEHLWVASVGGVEYVHLVLFGVKDTTEQDRLRQAAHAAWIEEAAPASVEATGGLDEAALGVVITSLRLPSYHHPVLVTSNYGSESHWTWRRYAMRQQPGTRLIRIPPGERASAEQRAEWMQANEGRPDLQRRLVQGEPAVIVAGEGVLHGVWNADVHVSRQPLEVVPGGRVVLGHDCGLRPATVVVQEVRGQLRVLASLVTAHGGMAQHIAGVVLPWLERHQLLGARAAVLEHRIDPAGTVGDQGDSSGSPERTIRRMLPGPVREGPTKWPPRIEPLLGVLGRMVAGQPALIVAPGPDTAVLREAAAGKWFYPRRSDGEIVRELPEKNHPHSDVGDALCYAVAALAPTRIHDGTKPPQKYATRNFDPLTGRPRVVSTTQGGTDRWRLQ